MRPFLAAAVVFLISFTTTAQKPDDILATSTGHTYRVSSLSAETQNDLAEMPGRVSKGRTSLLEQMIAQRVLDAEAAARGVTRGRLMAEEKAKVPDPSEDEIKTVLEANQEALSKMTAQQARHRVVAFLRGTPEQKAVGALITQLKAKHKAFLGKDVNAAGLAPADIVATVNSRPITAREFEAAARVPMYEAQAELADVVLEELKNAIYVTIVGDEARSLDIDPGTLIAREITDKLKDYSDEERLALEAAFTKKLYAKYAVKILYKAPAPVLQTISLDDDPATGPLAAPVKIVMFSDFQCSACAAAHPMLKHAMAAFPGKIRFVVRDFPLESIHENAFLAARAAGAAHVQGKFAEFTELLYKRQDALDAGSLKKYAAEIGLNVKQFELDFNSEKTAAEIRKDMSDGDSYGITSTPAIYVNGIRVRELSPDGFRQAIERALGR